MQFSQHKRQLLNMYKKVVQFICAYTTFKRPLTQSSFLCCLIGSSPLVSWEDLEDHQELVWGQLLLCEVGGYTFWILFITKRCVTGLSSLSLTVSPNVMDPLLKKLESASFSLKINYLFVGGFANADDIRTITNSTSSLMQCPAVSSFTSCNVLQLNPSKCEIVSFSR